MPRRKRTGPRRTKVDATKVWQHRGRMEEIVSHYAPSQLTEAAWQQLVEDLIDCVAYAMAGLKGIERVSIATLNGRVTIPFRVAGYGAEWNG